MSKPQKTALRVAGLVVVLAVAGFTLRRNLPDLGQTLDVLRSAQPWWLVLAAAAEMTSLRHFALQQRRLLAGFGVRMSVPRAIAVTFTRSAISFSLPAGSAVSAGLHSGSSAPRAPRGARPARSPCSPGGCRGSRSS